MNSHPLLSLNTKIKLMDRHKTFQLYFILKWAKSANVLMLIITTQQKVEYPSERDCCFLLNVRTSSYRDLIFSNIWHKNKTAEALTTTMLYVTNIKNNKLNSQHKREMCGILPELPLQQRIQDSSAFVQRTSCWQVAEVTKLHSSAAVKLSFEFVRILR